MRYIKNLFYALCLCVGVLSSVHAQEENMVTAIVTDAEGNPIPGVIINFQEGGQRVFTNQEGVFTVKGLPTDFVLIEKEGYEPVTVSIDNIRHNSKIVMETSKFLAGDADKIYMPFRTTTKNKVTGSVIVINPEDIKKYDASQSIWGIISRHAPNVRIDASNLSANVVVIVDGVYNDINVPLLAQEVEQIVVLNDLSSRLLYGVRANQALIMITTKRGKANKREFNVMGRTGISTVKSTPNYLETSDYMRLYNEALENDGLQPKWSDEQIAEAASGSNPLFYPNNKYYTDEFMRNSYNSQQLIVDASGGNERAQYYFNMGWNTNSSLLKVGYGDEQKWHDVNVRGNVNYKLNNYLKMFLDASANYDIINKAPRYKNYDFWEYAANTRPNVAPLLVDSSLLAPDQSGVATVVQGNNLVLGGSNEPDGDVNIYGDLLSRGFKTTLGRTAQIRTGFDIDFDKLIKGLTARGLVSFDTYNTINVQNNNKDYSVWIPGMVVSQGRATDSLIFTKKGEDKVGQDLANSGLDFNQRFSVAGHLNYNRTFGIHDISAVLVNYLDHFIAPGMIHPDRLMHLGLQANYMYDNKYIVDVTGVWAGSSSLPTSNNKSLSTALALGWVLSNKDFLSDNSMLNYLKLRGSFGVHHTDATMSGLYMYLTAFNTGTYTYNYGNSKSNALPRITVGNENLDWVKTNDINLGFDAAVLDKALWLEANYFKTNVKDLLIRRSATTSAYVGTVYPWENYEAYDKKGLEAQIRYTHTVNDFQAGLGLNLRYIRSTHTKVDELYKDDYLYQAGTDRDAIWGYVSQGLYSDADFTNGSLNDELPKPTFGDVRVGDIKYQDLNGDGVIDQNDQKIIGHGNRFATGINVNLAYKGFELYAHGSGSFGGSTKFTGNYYWVDGTDKYTEVTLNRYHPQNNPSGTMPRLTSKSDNHNFQLSDYWLENGNVFYLSNVQLTYNLPGTITSKLFMKSAHIYVSGNNLLTFSEVKEKRELTVGRQPSMRHFNLGLNLTF